MSGHNTLRATAEGESAAGKPLLLRNGQAVPLGHVPVLSYSMFSHVLQSALRDGERLAALFAVPPQDYTPKAYPLPGKTPEGEFQLMALTANDSGGHIAAFATVIEGSFPSLTPRVPQAHLFERDIHEKYGLMPEGHPWLKPVRFSRPGGPDVGIMDFYRIAGDEVHEVAVGPVHAGIIECGHFRFQCLGELVMHLEISLGYHHRGLESLLDAGPDRRSLPLVEALSGDASIAHTWAWCALVEALSGMRPSPRGQILRALALELERLANHTGDLGALSGDVGFLPTQSYCGRLRGDWLNMTALLCGNRFGRGLLRPGGVAFDLDAYTLAELKERLQKTARDVDGALQVLWDSPSVMARFSGIGKVELRDAVALGLLGVAARACGLERDARVSHPLEGTPAPPPLQTAPWGDVHARARVRHREVQASVALCRRLLEEFLEPGGPQEQDEAGAAFCGDLPALRPDCLAVSLVEAWRGEVCHVALTGPDGRIRTLCLTDPSFHNWMGLAMALRGQQISDFPLCNKSFNLSYCGHDL